MISKTISDGAYLEAELYDAIRSDGSLISFFEAGAFDGMWYWDLTRPEMEWMSPRFWTTLGYDPQEKRHFASEWQDLIFPEDLETARNNLALHIENANYPFDQVVRYHHRLGHTIWVRCRGIAVRDNDGTAIRLLAIHADLTEQMQAAAQATSLEYQIDALKMQIEALSMKVSVRERRIKELELRLSARTGGSVDGREA